MNDFKKRFAGKCAQIDKIGDIGTPRVGITDYDKLYPDEAADIEAKREELRAKKEEVKA